MPDSYNIEVGKRIHDSRKKLKMSMKELGARVNLHESTVSRYEKGDIKTLDLEKIEEFAKVLGVSSSYLAVWENNVVSSTSFNKNNNILASDNTNSIKSIANKLKLLRESRHLTTTELANELHIDASLYMQYENGEKEVPFTFIKNMADYFGVSLADFFNSVDVQYGFNSHVLVTVDHKSAILHKLWIEQVGEFDWTEDEFQQIVNYALFLKSQRKD